MRRSKWTIQIVWSRSLKNVQKDFSLKALSPDKDRTQSRAAESCWLVKNSAGRDAYWPPSSKLKCIRKVGAAGFDTVIMSGCSPVLQADGTKRPGVSRQQEWYREADF